MSKVRSEKEILNSRMFNIADTVSTWCDDCHVYAAKFFMWNTDSEDAIAEIASAALDTLPGKVGPHDWPSTIRKAFKGIHHCHLIDFITQLHLMLESPCISEECQRNCDEFKDKIHVCQ